MGSKVVMYQCIDMNEKDKGWRADLIKLSLKLVLSVYRDGGLKSAKTPHFSSANNKTRLSLLFDPDVAEDTITPSRNKSKRLTLS